MFKTEKIHIVDLKERTLKLEQEGRIVALIFIKNNEIIIKGELDVGDSSIISPIIKKM